MRYDMIPDFWEAQGNILYNIYARTFFPDDDGRIEQVGMNHKAASFEVIFCTGGPAVILIDRKEEIILNETDIIIIHPNVVHGFNFHCKPWEVTSLTHHIFQFQPSFLYSSIPLPSDIQYLFLPLKYKNKYTLIKKGDADHGTVFSLLQSIEKESQSKLPGYDISLRALFSLLYTYLIRNSVDIEESLHETGKNDGNVELFKKVLLYIDEHFHEQLSLQDLAKHFNISYYHFSRLFQSYTNRRFRDYLLSLRINKAQKMLMDENISITSVAMDCGFTTPSNFLQKFKQITGMTPTNFRKHYFDKK